MFKIIKTSNWTATSTGVKGTTYVVAYKGRVFTINKEDFPELKVNEKDQTLTLGEVPEIRIDIYTDALGQTKKGLRMVPKLDLVANEFGI